jgi:hypothetical protein
MVFQPVWMSWPLPQKVQPINKIWAFSKKWYDNHLNPEWTKWTVDDAKRIFQAFELERKIWNLGDSK